MFNWQPQHLSEVLRIPVRGAGANKLHFDSRQIKENDIFLALSGEQADGHQYIKSALDNGASYAIIKHLPTDLVSSLQMLVVPDPYKALWDLADYNRTRTTAKVIGVTGSAGKTSLKEILQTILGKVGTSFASQKSFNNHLGVPITLASAPHDNDFIVLEMGMNHAGELANLTKLVRPDIAVITTIAPAHMEFFATTADVASAKLEIMQGLSTQGGIAILPRDNEHYQQLLTGTQRYTNHIYTFGYHAEAHSKILSYNLIGSTAVIELEVHGRRLTYQTRLVGRHQALNISAALLILDLLGVDLNLLEVLINNLTPFQGRGSIIKANIAGKGVEIVDDSYNSNPASMITSIKHFDEMPGMRKIAVLGDMLELGEKSAEYHKDLAKHLINSSIDVVLTVGSLMRNLYEELPLTTDKMHYRSNAELQEELPHLIKEHDLLLFKGSNAMQLSSVITKIIS